MWDFLQAVQSSYVIQGVYGGRQTSVETEDLKGLKRSSGLTEQNTFALFVFRQQNIKVPLWVHKHQLLKLLKPTCPSTSAVSGR